MNKTFRRICSLVLAALMVTPTALAYEVSQSVESNSNVNHIINESAFDDVFRGLPNVMGINGVGEEADPVVEYSYIVTPKNGGKYDVTLDFTVILNETAYDFSTSGICSEESVTEDLSVLNGGLRGESEINGREYNVTVGFIKDADGDAITAGVTLFPVSYTDNSEIARFSFGESVITPDMVQETTDDAPEESAEGLAAASATEADTFEFCDDVAVYFDSASSGNIPAGIAGRIRLYYNEYDDRAAIALGSYTSHVDNTFEYLDGVVPYRTSVMDATFGMERGGGSSVDSLRIDGLDSLESFDYATGDDSPFLDAVFDFVVSVFGNAVANYVKSVMDQASTDFSFSINQQSGDRAEVTIDCSIFNDINFDNGNYLTIPVNLDSPDSEPRTSPFNVYGEISYFTSVAWTTNYEYYFTYSEWGESPYVYLTAG